MRAVRVAATATVVAALTACSGEPRPSADPTGTPSPSGTASTPTPSPPSGSGATTGPTAPPSTASPGATSPGATGGGATAGQEPTPPRAWSGSVRRETAVETVQFLAGVVGPRHGTSEEFHRAAQWVGWRFRALGYDVERQPFSVPGGDSWGVQVESGRSVNVVATQGEVDRRQPHLVVGAHLDTVPQAPGAEDNASGVGAMLAVAEAVADRRTRLPVVFVAFGAEEPRGPSDDDHHYGSRFYVSQLTPAEREAVRGMVSLDRVGVGQVMPVCSATAPPGRLRADVLAAAERAGVRAVEPCTDNRASDHWSFVRNGMPGVRLGSTPFAGYHSPGDVPDVVDPAQLLRAARTTVAWLAGG